MEGEDGNAEDLSNRPPLTWGSTSNVASGTTSSISTSYNPHGQPLRVLNLHASPDGSQSHRIHNSNSAEVSSPVEDFSSPGKQIQHSDLGSFPSEEKEIPFIARVGDWNVPEMKEREATQVNIDPNGDDEEVASQVQRMIALERELKRKRLEEQRVSSSMPSQETGLDFAPSPIPRASTPPSKRQRRSRTDKSPSPVMEKAIQTSAPSGSDRQSNESMDLSDVMDPLMILNDPLTDASRYSILKYAQASPLIPDFLKEEIVRCISNKAQASQSQGARSDSDTLEDGFLKTKPFWVFELLRINNKKGITAGSQMTSEVKMTESTLVLHIFSDILTYGVQLVDRGALMMSRNEARSNPWFDGNGHPFNIVYRKPVSINGSNETSSSIHDPSNAEQLSNLQNEVERLSGETREALSAQEEAEKRYKDALATNRSTQDDNDFLRERYSEASSTAAELAKANQQLLKEIESLKERLSEGIRSIRAFSENRLSTLQSRLKVTEGQLHLLVQQNRLTNDTIREKAAKWDDFQARERTRVQALEKKRAEIDEERAALYKTLQEEEMQQTSNYQKLPHELFLETDLTREKESLGGNVILEEESELAMLRAEAEGATGDVLDLSAPRSSRRRRPVEEDDDNQEQSNVAELIAQTQEQAQTQVANVLQEELDFFSSQDQQHQE